MAGTATTRKESAASELVQIIQLTLAMTGTGLMALWLVFHFFLVPNLQAQAREEAQNYDKLTKLLLSDNMQSLRAQAELDKDAGDRDRAQQDIIKDMEEANGLSVQRLSLEREDRGAQIQTVSLNAAPLAQILRFIVGVKEAKKSIEVQKVDLRPPSRGQQAGQYTATIDFVDYSPPKKR